MTPEGPNYGKEGVEEAMGHNRGVSRRSLYIETTIDASLQELWEKSQDPTLHQRWDLRFSEIEYLPKDPDGPQRFVYASRVAGIRVHGTGESIGERFRPDGASSSSLRFWSDHPLALISEGSGFWRYEPTSQGVRFYTGYDYRVRWGWLGVMVDRFLFRPWIGWATAWSFDRLRLWLERGIQPETSMALSVSHLSARLGLAAMWIYQGLVPKLVSPEGEVALATAAGVPYPERAVPLIGAIQIGFGLLLLVVPKWRWLYLVTALAMIPLTLAILLSSPDSFLAPFNPFGLNVVAAALGIVGYVTWPDRPSAARCLRRPPRGTDVDL
jgi:uncharacterized membrane protein YphA (DoxX/SURF4 family)